MHQPFTLSFVTIFSKGVSLYSLLLDYLLEGGNYLLSPPWLSSQRWQPSALSSLAIFSNAATLCSQPFARNPLLSPHCLSSRTKAATLTLSSLTIFLKAAIIRSILLDYPLESGNLLLSPSCIPPK